MMRNYYIGGFYWEDEGYKEKPDANDLYVVVYEDKEKMNKSNIIFEGEAIDVEKQSGDKIFDFPDFFSTKKPYDTAIVKSHSNSNINYGLVDVFEDIEYKGENDE